jgi:hypothetical protein
MADPFAELEAVLGGSGGACAVAVGSDGGEAAIAAAHANNGVDPYAELESSLMGLLSAPSPQRPVHYRSRPQQALAAGADFDSGGSDDSSAGSSDGSDGAVVIGRGGSMGGRAEVLEDMDRADSDEGGSAQADGHQALQNGAATDRQLEQKEELRLALRIDGTPPGGEDTRDLPLSEWLHMHGAGHFASHPDVQEIFESVEEMASLLEDEDDLKESFDAFGGIDAALAHRLWRALVATAGGPSASSVHRAAASATNAGDGQAETPGGQSSPEVAPEPAPAPEPQPELGPGPGPGLEPGPEPRPEPEPEPEPEPGAGWQSPGMKQLLAALREGSRQQPVASPAMQADSGGGGNVGGGHGQASHGARPGPMVHGQASHGAGAMAAPSSAGAAADDDAIARHRDDDRYDDDRYDDDNGADITGQLLGCVRWGQDLWWCQRVRWPRAPASVNRLRSMRHA